LVSTPDTARVVEVTCRLAPLPMTIDWARPPPVPALRNGYRGAPLGMVRASRAVGTPLGVQLKALL
jgi:hypothetical protein